MIVFLKFNNAGLVLVGEIFLMINDNDNHDNKNHN